MSASWYDVLGLDRDASADEIRSAWKASIADLEPTDRRFKVYNEAAGVLLDPSKRSAYDAQLPAEESDEALAPEDLDEEPAGDGPGEGRDVVADETSPVVVDAPDDADEAEAAGATDTADKVDDAGEADDVHETDTDADDTDAGDTDADNEGSATPTPKASAEGDKAEGDKKELSTKLLAALAVLVLLVAAVAAVLHVTYDDPDDVEKAMAEARRAAESAVPKVIAYDYKFPERSHDQAMRVLGGDLKSEYDDVWTDTVEPNLAKSKASLTSQAIATGLVRSSGGGDRVQVLTVVQVHAVNSEGTQDAVVTLTATMVNHDGTWLVEELDGWDAGLAEEAEEKASDAPSSGAPSPGASSGSSPSPSGSSPSPSGSASTE
ncbi:Mce-associated membrane protein [Nocardioides daedukensis]|uniref:Mce-associated membrane protein n=1 Tax=Nocardioides daedukensis TaxID=634462 RepID=A0A7Y9S259_9ACTN|nr:Mce-associated membrane protein [Nocardioides daedukensis]